ncbi:CPBP family intramembrane glutamic endopeptidase [Candidatus Nitrotoga fabula]|uniref:Abortive infection protein n=1 Tax=Candidatus Nitrotoga fabula TaxID=2182327 RepID=A0A916BF57_9PROT|nr:CPBP family intramembrane glutamic endopeptidase [Candidatus Nitrotoga fabula]CAE6698354.1 Abortive infection protein [Candidatus Nitrotoga fabula]
MEITQGIPMAIPFGLLALSMITVWLPPLALGKACRMPAWLLLFAAASTSALATGYLEWSALPTLAFFLTAAFLGSHPEAGQIQRTLFSILTALTALALALHLLPGFNNPVLLSGVRLSPDAAPLMQYANFDKGAAGLVLLAWFCNRTTSAWEWKEIGRKIPVIILVTTASVLIAAVLMHYLHFQPKLPAFTPVFLAANLFFTCVAEEAFFRGFLQERITSSLSQFRPGVIIAILCSGLLFGLAHAAGGVSYMLLATMAGLGYASAYARVRRIEAAIITHFIVNTTHFIGFTYPHAA